ncbi:MAG: hypothetical protein IJS35_05220 [Firmicutes bacterium]|nr:hypothetical protein [Bacillota bacterium]
MKIELSLIPKLKLRLFSFLLVLVLTAGNLSQVCVYADEKEKTVKPEST